MKVFFYLREFPVIPGVSFTGPMKAIHGMASVLATYNLEVSVLCEGQTDCEVNHSGYSIRSFRNERPNVPFYLAPGLKKFIAGQRKNGDSLFILNGNFNPCLYAVGRCLSRYSLPYIAASHSAYDPAVFQLSPYKKWPYWYLFERPLLKRSSAIQVLDFRQQKGLQRLGVKKHVFEVLNGFSNEDIVPEESLSWNRCEEAKIMYFGRLDSYTKGLDMLLEAYSRIGASVRGSLVFKGPDNGEDRAQLLQQSVASGTAETVSFEGPEYSVPPSHVLRDADVVCLPSRYEGFGLTALEAMIAGRVLLVSECSGIAPHVQASGCGVVVQSNARSIREGLEDLLQSRADWKQMGLRGRRYAIENLRWEIIAATALVQYRNLLRTHRRGAKRFYAPSATRDQKLPVLNRNNAL